MTETDAGEHDEVRRRIVARLRLEEIVVIPKYRNDPSLEELTELISRLRDAFPQADVRRQDQIEPKGHEATFWEVVQLVFGDVSNATTIATAVVVVKGYLKKRREEQVGYKAEEYPASRASKDCTQRSGTRWG